MTLSSKVLLAAREIWFEIPFSLPIWTGLIATVLISTAFSGACISRLGRTMDSQRVLTKVDFPSPDEPKIKHRGFKLRIVEDFWGGERRKHSQGLGWEGMLIFVSGEFWGELEAQVQVGGKFWTFISMEDKTFPNIESWSFCKTQISDPKKGREREGNCPFKFLSYILPWWWN